MYGQLRLFAGIAVLVLIVSVLVALALSSRLQRPIFAPPFLLLLKLPGSSPKTRTTRYVRPRWGVTKLSVDRRAQSIARQHRRTRQRHCAPRTKHSGRKLSNAKNAEEKVHSQLERLELLHRITRAISERQDLKSIFQVVIRTLEEHLPLDFSLRPCLYDPINRVLSVNSVGVRSEALSSELGKPGVSPMLMSARMDFSVASAGSWFTSRTSAHPSYPFSNNW